MNRVRIKKKKFDLNNQHRNNKQNPMKGMVGTINRVSFQLKRSDFAAAFNWY